MRFPKFIQIFAVALCCAHLIGPAYGNGAAARKQRSLSELDEHEKNVVKRVSEQLIEKLGPRRTQIIQWARNMVYEVEPLNEYVNCDVCLPALTIVRPLLSLFPDPTLIVEAVILLCEVLDIAPTPALCRPTIVNFADPLLFIAKNKTINELSNTDFCGIINPGCHPVSSRFTDWEIEINPDKPPVANPDPVPDTEKGVKILQFTDLHIDLDYKEGTPANCDGPICCRVDTNSTGSEEAGKYGSYSCALPVEALDAILDRAATTHPDVKYIFLTGDYIHSGVWLYNEAENSRHIGAVTSRLKAKFPNAKVFPITGNHEAAPCNQYPPPEVWSFNDHQFDLEWVYQATMADFPELFAGIDDQRDNFLRGGYYTVKPEADSNLRLVILNSNLCYIENFWLAYDPVDPAGQLQWFANTMYAAEQARENVLILSHIMPGSGSCWPVWADKYDKIVNRFENIVKGQFYGHSHTDYYSLSFERGTNRPTTTHYVAPSMLTDGMPSAWRLYYADGDRGMQSTWEILDYETHILDTYESNDAGSPVFKHLYSAKEMYGLASFRPHDLYNLTLRMISDYPLFQKFENFHYKNSTRRGRRCPPPRNGEPECVVKQLCETVDANSGDKSHCSRLYQVMEHFLRPPPSTTTGTSTTTTMTTTSTTSTTRSPADSDNAALLAPGPVFVTACAALLHSIYARIVR